MNWYTGKWWIPTNTKQINCISFLVSWVLHFKSRGKTEIKRSSIQLLGSPSSLISGLFILNRSYSLNVNLMIDYLDLKPQSFPSDLFNKNLTIWGSPTWKTIWITFKQLLSYYFVYGVLFSKSQPVSKLS